MREERKVVDWERERNASVSRGVAMRQNSLLEERVVRRRRRKTRRVETTIPLSLSRKQSTTATRVQ